MQQAFTRTALNGYLELMQPSIDRMLSTWPAAQTLPFYDAIKHLLPEQATEVFVGARLGPESDRLSADFHATVRRLLPQAASRPPRRSRQRPVLDAVRQPR